MPPEPPPPPGRQPWSGDEDLEAPDYLGAAPSPESQPNIMGEAAETPGEERRLMHNPFSAEAILEEPSLLAPRGTSRRGPYIGWSVVALIVIVVVLLATGTIRIGSSPSPQPSPVGLVNTPGMPRA